MNLSGLFQLFPNFSATLFMPALCLVAFWAVYRLAGNVNVKSHFVNSGLFGRDLHRKDMPIVPESMGIIAGLVFLIVQFFLIPLLFLHHSAPSQFDNAAFPFDQLASYLSALLSLSCMLFLGFADDVFDLRWRFKLLLPTIASIPLLVVYYVTYGVTFVIVPRPFRFLLGGSLDLGALYYVYMGMLAVFCTNSINILAGINGVEVGQTLIIGFSIVLNDILYLTPLGELLLDRGSRSALSYQLHLFSLCLTLPFLAVSLALFLRNKYPAEVFVGDTFCYFSGMLFAVVGILGHYSKTMLLFFTPQIFNFLLSIPQLFHIVPCPRHRMPAYVIFLLMIVAHGFTCRFDAESNLLHCSFAEISPQKDSELKQNQTFKYYFSHFILTAFSALGLIRLEVRPEKSDDPVESRRKPSRKINRRNERELAPIQKQIFSSEKFTHCSNLTLLNVILLWRGPMTERALCYNTMFLQLLFGCIIPFLIRYVLVGLFY